MNAKDHEAIAALIHTVNVPSVGHGYVIKGDLVNRLADYMAADAAAKHWKADNQFDRDKWVASCYGESTIPPIPIITFSGEVDIPYTEPYI